MAIIWGIPYLLIKVAVGELTPVTLVFFRTALGALLLLPLAIGRGEIRPLFRFWPWVLAYTVVEVSLPWFLLSDAERRLSSSLTGLLIAAVPLIGAIITWLTRGDDRLDARRLAGLLLGLTGVAALVGLDVSFKDLGAVAEVGLVAIGYATGPIIVARRLQSLPSIGVVAASLVITAIGYAPLALSHAPARMPSFQVLSAVIALGVVCTAVAFLLFFALIAEVGPVRATVITYFNPAVALLLGVALLREPFTVGDVVGFALILSGSVLATRRVSSPSADGATSTLRSASAGPDRPEPQLRSQGSGR
jgi:drug/metabolite transporter (DMT)-like permease